MIFVFSRWWKNHLDHCWRLDPIRSSKFTTSPSAYSLLICYKAFHKKNTDLDIWFDRSVVTFCHLSCFQFNSRWIEVLPIPLAVSISKKSSLSYSGIHYLYRIKLWIKKNLTWLAFLDILLSLCFIWLAFKLAYTYEAMFSIHQSWGWFFDSETVGKPTWRILKSLIAW